MRTRRELEPKGPKPASPSALGSNNSSSQHPATVTFSPVDVQVETRWPPHLGAAILATVQRAFSIQDPEAHFSSGSFTMSSFRLGRQGASSLDAQAAPQPCPALSHPSCVLVPATTLSKSSGTFFCAPMRYSCVGNPLMWVWLSPPGTTARQTDGPGVFWSGVRGQSMLPSVSSKGLSLGSYQNKCHSHSFAEQNIPCRSSSTGELTWAN